MSRERTLQSIILCATQTQNITSALLFAETHSDTVVMLLLVSVACKSLVITVCNFKTLTENVYSVVDLR